MSFNSSLPARRTRINSDELRNQFNGLKADYEAQIAAIPAGPPGPPGPPFATAVVDGVSTLGPEDAATVSASFDGNNVHFTFGLPRGHDGANGNDGPKGDSGDKGDKGDQGDKGDPGDVSTQQLNNAIDGTARNISGVIGAFGGSFSDPPTQSELQAFADYIESFRQGLVR